MSFASDVKAKTVTATGDAVNGRTRVQGVYYTCTGTASGFTLKTGGASGTTIFDIKTPSAAGAYDIIMPDNGVLFDKGVFIDFADAQVTSVMLLFCGGAAA